MSDLDRARALDAAARVAAQRVFDAPFVLSAGAGTGKTTVLIARVLAWTVGPGWERHASRLGGAATQEHVAAAVLDGVVAITFTEAAAAEMEQRAMDGFAALVAGRAVRGFDAPPEAVDCAARARALLAAFDHLQVQTIHAYCRRLLAAHPLEAGWHPRFRVDARGALRSGVIRTLLEERMRAMAEHGDADLEALLLEEIGAPDLEEVLDALVEGAVPAEAFAIDPLDPARLRAWRDAMSSAIRELAGVAGDRFADLGARAIARQIGMALVESDAAIASEIDSQAALETALAKLRAAWPENRTARLASWARADLDASETRVLGAERISALAAASSRLVAVVRAAVELDPKLLALLHRVVSPLLRDAERRLTELGAASFDGLLRRTGDLLRTHPAIARATRRSIDQLLVDEFQDTDAVQCEIVATLALEGDAADRPGLFLVGDPKQSVYGFRNADIGAYLAFVARVGRDPRAVHHELCVNHRSVAAILDEVERVVEPVMIEREGVQPAFQRLVARDGAPEARRAVEYWWSSRWDHEARAFAKTRVPDATAREARHLAADLCRLRATGIDWKQVGVLFRSTSDLDVYLAALRRAGVPYCVDRDRSFYRRREVLDAAAIVRCALDPNDQLALVTALRAPWVGLPDAAWRPLWCRDFPAVARAAIDGEPGAATRVRTVAEAAATDVAALVPDVPGLAALAGFEQSLVHGVAVLAQLRRVFQTEPIERFVEAVRTISLVEATEAARHPGAFRLSNLSRFFRELHALLEDHAGDVASVLRALRRDASELPEFYEGRAQDPGEDAVQIMTIHGAKGLDFEHVYLMQVHKGTSAFDDRAEHAIAEHGVEWRLPLARRRVATLGWGAVRARRDAVAEAEIARMLYVALTRAKSRLVIAGLFDTTERRSHAARIWVSREPALAAARARLAARQAEAAPSDYEHEDGVHVVGLAVREIPAEAAPAESESIIAALSRIRADATTLAALDDAASQRRSLALVSRASDTSRAELREAALPFDPNGDAGEVDSVADASADVAARVGTLVHALLERLDLREPEVARAALVAREGLCDELSHHVSRQCLDVAVERAAAILDAFVASPLWERRCELASHDLARELPVLLAADAGRDGAVGCVAGTIDWIYWDAIAAEVVIVDFKTDLVAAQDGIERNIDAYRSQAARYRRAVQEALGLPRPPRVELWFLAASRSVVVEPEGGAAGGP